MPAPAMTCARTILPGQERDNAIALDRGNSFDPGVDGEYSSAAKSAQKPKQEDVDQVLVHEN